MIAKEKFRACSCIAAACMVLAVHTNAATYTWDGGGANQGWNTAANWNPDVNPTYGTTCDIVIGGTLRVSEQYLVSDKTVRSITFDASNDANTTIRCSVLPNASSRDENITFNADSGNATITVDADATGNKSINRQMNASDNDQAKIFLTDTVDVYQHGAGILTMGNGDEGWPYGCRVQGAGGINKYGSGRLRFNGHNIFTGDTVMYEGTLQVNHVTALSATTLNTGTSGAQVVEFIISGANTYHIGGLAGEDELAIGANTISVGANNAATDFYGILSGSGNLIKVGNNTLRLYGTNTFSGTTTVNSSGALKILHDDALGSTAAGTIVNNGGALRIEGGIAVGAEALTLNGAGTTGNGALRNTVDNNSYAGAITLGSASAIESSADTLTLTGGIINGGYLLSMQGDGDTTVSTTAISGTGGLTKTGAGTLFLSAANSYTGATTISNGTLRVNSPGSLNASSAVTVESGGTLGGDGTVNGTVSVSSGGNLSPGSAASTIGTLTLTDSSASALTLDASLINCNLPNSGTTCDLIAITGDLVLNGNGIVTLSAPSGSVPAGVYTTMTYSAQSGSGDLNFPNGTKTMWNSTLAINAGDVTVTVGAGGLISTVWKGNVAGSETVWDTTATNWTRNGTDLQAYVAGDPVTFDDTATTFATITGTESPGSVLFNNTTDYTLSAIIGGASTPLIKAGSGTTTLTGANTYGGATTVNAGVLNIRNATALGGTGSGTTVSDGAALEVQGAITTAEPLTLNGEGVAGNSALRNIVNNNTFSGVVTLGSDSRVQSDSGTLYFTAGINNGGNQLTVRGAGTTQINTTGISGSGGLINLGSGNLLLNIASTYSGGTIQSNGILSLNRNNCAGTGTITLSGGTVQNVNYGTLITNTIYVTTNTITAVNAEDPNWTISGPITGSGTFKNDSTTSSSLYMQGDISGFTGTFLHVNQNNDNNWAFTGTTAASQDGSNAKFYLTGGKVGSNRSLRGGTASAPIFKMGELSGTGGRIALYTGGTTLEIGALGTSPGAYDGVIVNIGPVLSLKKVGAGTLELSEPNTYTGTTTIEAGTLKFSGNGGLSRTDITVTGTGTLAIQPGSATANNLGATGTAADGATLNLGGRIFDMTDGAISTCNLLQAADFAGTALTITDGATLNFDLTETGADQLAVSKTAAASGTINVTIDTTGASSLTHGSYDLITAEAGSTLNSATWQYTGGGIRERINIAGIEYDLVLSASATAITLEVQEALGSFFSIY